MESFSNPHWDTLSKGRSLIFSLRHLSTPTVFSNINIFLLIVFNIRSCLPCLVKYFCPCSNWQVNIYTLTCIIFIFRSPRPGLKHIRKKTSSWFRSIFLMTGTEQYRSSKQCSAQTYRRPILSVSRSQISDRICIKLIYVRPQGLLSNKGEEGGGGRGSS